jgi:hypothetical protein
MHGKFPNKMTGALLLFLAVAVYARAAEDPKSAQSMYNNMTIMLIILYS